MFQSSPRPAMLQLQQPHVMYFCPLSEI